MNIDQFLHYWSRHNTTIIEVLIAVILLTVIYLAFRAFLAGKNTDASSSIDGGLNSDQLEKTLQKILENQQGVKTHKELSPIEQAEADAAQSAAAAKVKAELDKVKAELVEKEKAIEQLKTKAATPGAAGGAGAGAAPAAAAAAGGNKELEAKIKDLEARLAEYEIISEDIADLSFYKEENTKLQKELEALKGGAPVAAATPPSAAPKPAEPAPAPVAEKPSLADQLVAAAETAPAKPTEPTPAPVAEKPSLADQLVAAAETAPAKPAGDANEKIVVSGGAGAADNQNEKIVVSSSPTAAETPVVVPAAESAIDDDLMKEFAAAVEGQKKATQTVSSEPVSELPEQKFPVEENKQLMKEFEDFTAKKS